MKTADQVHPNYAPVYAAALYPDLAKLFVKHGYALAVHGSLAHDLDLIAVPWAKEYSPITEVLKEMTEVFAVRIVDKWEREHGRIGCSISVGFGQCTIDLSWFMIL